MATKTRWQRSKISNLYLETETGVYYARCDNAAGKDTWRSLATKSFEIAKLRLPAKLGEIQAGKLLCSSTAPNETWGEVAAFHRARIQADPSLAPTTIHYYGQLLDAIGRSWPQLKDSAPRTITEDACLRWAKGYRKVISPRRFNNTISQLQQVFALAIEMDLIPNRMNPALKINRAPLPPKKLTLPTQEQFHAIVGAVRKSGAWCAQDCADLIEFLAYSGARISEAARVRWSDINRQEIQLLGKGNKLRSVPIIPPMRDLLDRLSRRTHEPRNPLRQGKNFVLYVTECREALTNACKKVGAPRLTHHKLRDLFASRCVEVGTPVSAVAAWLGHVDKGVLLMQTYSHVRDEFSQAMAAKVVF